MPILSVTIQNINPQYNPQNPFTPPKVLQQVQVAYSGTSPGPANGVMTLYAVREGTNPPEVVQLGQQALNPNTENSSVDFNNVSLSALSDAPYRFYAVATQSNGAAITSNTTPQIPMPAYPVDGDVPIGDPICFLAGTRIRTPAGDVPVEALRIGDLVTTLDGRAEPILFIGRQSYGTRFADRETTLPIRIRAGALAEGLPAVDLWVSPCHALHIDGVLMFAQALLNGSTIAQVSPPEDTFTYYSLELERHEVILAEGAEVESFADNVPRTRFHNHSEFEALYPEGREVGEMDLPHAKSARQVPAAIRARIAERAALIGGQSGVTRAA